MYILHADSLNIHSNILLKHIQQDAHQKEKSFHTVPVSLTFVPAESIALFLYLFHRKRDIFHT